MPDPISWLIIGISIIGSFFASACETAIGCCNRFKIQIKADNGSKAAKVLLKVCASYDRAISTILILNNIFAVVVSAISTLVFYRYLSNIQGIEEYVPLISSIIMAFVVYILGDTLPKTIAKAIPDTISLFFAYVLYGFVIIFTPISFFFELFAKAIDKIFRVKDEKDFTEEDFHSVVEQVSEEGILEEEQEEIINSAMDFVDTNVKEVLTPRSKIFALDINGLTHDKLNQLIANTKYSRIPIYDGNFDNFIGVLHVKSYLMEYMEDHHVSIEKTLQKPYFVSNSIMIDDLFNGFKKHHTHLALVVDNRKKVIGMVTMEDVLEEIVSDISEPNTQRGHK